MAERVIAAMSGGVDSSVAALLLHRQGYDVIGIGLRLPELWPTPETVCSSSCCGLAGMKDARQVAAQIGIPFYVLNYERYFDDAVIWPFCQAYAAGQTPNPCIDCNAHIKFGWLMQTALALGVDYLATGHYARMERPATGGEPRLLKALDPAQDQSYFLYRLTREQLRRTLFPLGGLRKSEVRQIAREAGLHVSSKPGSKDICFLQGTTYQAFLAERCPEAFQPGEIVDLSGTVVGQHQGIGAYTVGQRKGLGVAARAPLYVRTIDVATNRIVVGPREQVYMRTLQVGEVNWLDGDGPRSRPRLWVKTRYRSAEVPARVHVAPDGRLLVQFEEAQPAVAPGQAAVFYDGDTVVGGGVITTNE